MSDIVEILIRIAKYRQTDTYRPNDGSLKSDQQGVATAAKADELIVDAKVSYADGVFTLTYSPVSRTNQARKAHAGTQRLFGGR